MESGLWFQGDYAAFYNGIADQGFFYDILKTEVHPMLQHFKLLSSFRIHYLLYDNIIL